MRCCKAEIVYRVVGNCERMKIDLADTKVFARFYLLNAIFEGFGAFTRFFVIDVYALAYLGIAVLGGNVDGAIDGA